MPFDKHTQSTSIFYTTHLHQKTKIDILAFGLGTNRFSVLIVSYINTLQTQIYLTFLQKTKTINILKLRKIPNKHM